ncbi:DUF4914 family protein [Xylanimonas allomyrinae]|uniref:DUF4914 family protein n=1 Tax=Xylanimonas allomyrinae TaxID=2509459 RepID=A0A4P6EIE8_9MICO|nr:DUF4914 family protein [Xylanimonas allomyrinae]QAY62272.1 DUF4914 family protein [Xylanimonas allomyrinae]
MDDVLRKLTLPPYLATCLEAARSITIPSSRAELFELSLGPGGGDTFDVVFDVPGNGPVKEADVVRCRNGIAVNYPEDYIRRRDPDCMRIGDDLPSDKPRFADDHGPFAPVKQETLDWLADQDLIVVPFKAGGPHLGSPSLAVVPKNTAFFACALVDLQGFFTFDELGPFAPRSILYLAPPFRHTHFAGKQVVVHDRTESLHEIFAYNLYPGPSAKKGVFSALLDIGTYEGWLTAHASSVRVTTPYENETVIMHEGASGGGKSEMCQELRREEDGRVLLGTNVVTDEPYAITLSETSRLEPVTDDMTLCHPALQRPASGKMTVADAEDGWFVRVDNLTHYGEDPQLERAIIHPHDPLIFLNIEGTPGATCLPWEHVRDENGKPCSNPRVIIPRRQVRGIVDEPQQVDVRTFGVRMPACTAEQPTYGVMGLMHVIPPSLAWLWRLVTPRGDKNPSIGATVAEAAVIAHGGMVAEGVGSFWPFSTNTKVGAANLLLEQILAAPKTRFVLTPNQHIGAYKVDFAAEWLAREYLARRGQGHVRRDLLVPARCPLFGFAMREMKIDGQQVRPSLLRPELQSKVGVAAYDAGAAIITDFFKAELQQFLTPDLDPLGRRIIEACLADATLEDYLALTPLDID